LDEDLPAAHHQQFMDLGSEAVVFGNEGEGIYHG